VILVKPSAAPSRRFGAVRKRVRELRVFGERFRVEAGAGGFDCRFQALAEGVAVKPGRDYGQIFDHGHAWAPEEAVPAPEQAGIDRDRQAGDARPGIESGRALLVFRRRAGDAPGSLRVNEDLPSGGEHCFGGGGDLLQRLPAPPAVDCDLLRDDEIEAKQRHVGELALEDDGEVGRIFEQREGLKKRLMLGGDQDRAGGMFSTPR
jgi:hypothetical protein